MYRDYVKPTLGLMKLSEVKRPYIVDVLAEMERLGRSNQTRLHVYNLLHKMFEDAIDDELIQRSPVHKKDRPDPPETERDFLEPKESLLLMAAMKDHWLGPVIWIGLWCGLRPCEIQALQWKHVDRPRGQILIRQAFKRKAGINKIEPFPKQKKWGKATMPKQLVEYLDQIRGAKTDEDFVAPAKGGGMLNYIVLWRELKGACRKLGLKEITPHELRHSCSELWVDAGATEVDVGRQLNQRSPSTTSKYMHRSDSRLDALSERVGAVVLTNNEPPKLRVVGS